MLDSNDSVEMINGVPVVAAPAEIDVTTAEQLRSVLLESASYGHTTIVVDMTRTWFCDSCGLSVLVRAHKRAFEEGGELRLVIPPDGTVFRIFTLTSLYRFIPRFDSLTEALLRRPVALVRPLRPRPSPGLYSAAHPPGNLDGECALVAETRGCEQCGAVFAPRREHARFCGIRCRAAWNRERTGDPAAGASALQWSVIAMADTIARLPAISGRDRPRAFAAIGEAVWQVTLVDATLVRHHLDTYDGILARQAIAQRRRTEQTLAGLRFVRNHIGHEASLTGFLQPGHPGASSGRITGWSWKPVPEPALASLAPRGRAWEAARYRAYQEQLAACTIGQTFGRAAEFLELAAAGALSITVGDAHAGR